RRYWRYQAPLCRDHGTKLAANWLLATLITGWWGLISFFMNLGAVAADVRALLIARRLAPVGSVILPGQFGNAGSGTLPTVSGRMLGLAGLVLAGLIVAVAADLTFGPKQASALEVGDCFDEPATAGEVDEVPHHPCTQSHTAEVFAILTYTSSSDYP